MDQKSIGLFVTSPKKATSKNFQFLFIETKRLAESLEGLNSSLAQLPGEL